MNSERRVFGWESLLWCIGLCAIAATTQADLRVTRGGGESTLYSFDELDRSVGLIEREIADDYLYKQAKRYRGYDLARLFDVMQLPRDQQYLLVCTDGYEIEFDGKWLNDPRFQGLLAREDVEAHDAPWLPYRVGANPSALSPFYLAWSAPDAAAQAEARRTLPWPYALNEIRVHDPDALHTAARPTPDADTPVQEGFELFTTHCMKCHKINASGGSLGPELTTSPAIAFTDDAELADVISNITRYYPNSKMPTYVDVLNLRETQATVAYLRHINARATRRSAR